MDTKRPAESIELVTDGVLPVQALVTRTQYFLTVVMGGVVKVLLSVPTGVCVMGLTPSNH